MADIHYPTGVTFRLGRWTVPPRDAPPTHLQQDGPMAAREMTDLRKAKARREAAERTACPDGHVAIRYAEVALRLAARRR